MAETLSDVKAIKLFFEAEPHGRKVTVPEMTKLSKEERRELGDLCREALASK
jgi:hypothetical protein